MILGNDVSSLGMVCRVPELSVDSGSDVIFLLIAIILLVKLGPRVLTSIINQSTVFVHTCGMAALWMPSCGVENF